MALSFATTFDPFFPFTYPHRQFRTLCEFAHQMENAIAASDAVERRTPNYRYHRGAQGLRFEVELPGVAKEHIDIEMHGPTLSITAQRFKTEKRIPDAQKGGNEQNENNDAAVADNNSVTHVYKIRFNVGDHVDEGSIKAEHENGVLNMFVPFKGDGGVRTIAISES